MLSKTIQRSVILLVVVLVVGALIFGAQRAQLSKLDMSLRDRATEEAKAGDFETAAEHLQEHLQIVPDDEQAMEKLAGLLLKEEKDVNRQLRGIGLYDSILRRSVGRNDIRRLLAEELVKREMYKRPPNVDSPRELLEILLKEETNDSHLRFLLGKCQEHDGDNNRAVESYRQAAEQEFPERVEAYWRAADLLRFELKKPDAADRLIAAMVSSDPDDYQAYLQRGLYFTRVAEKEKDPAGKEKYRRSAQVDFERALKQKPTDPSIYVQLAELSLSSGKIKEARKILEDGLHAVPQEGSVWLRLDLAKMEKGAGSAEAAIKSLRESLQLLPDAALLHRELAELLADRGATTELLVQIEELKRLSDPAPVIQYLEARRQMNAREWKNASQLLEAILPLLESSAQWKARINSFLSICYERLGDRQRRDDARRRALDASPQSLQAQVQHAQELLGRGEIDQGIDAYRKLVGQFPQLRGILVSLLIAKNRRRPSADQDWTEIERLIDIAKNQSPDSSEHVLFRVDLLQAQGKVAEAQKLVAEALRRDPQKNDLWLKALDMLIRQQKFTEAQRLIDQHPQSVKPVDVKLERARLLNAQGGANLSTALAGLAADSSSYPPEDRRRLLEALARAFTEIRDFPQARQCWLEVANLDAKDIRPQVMLIDLAFQAGNDADIQQQITKIKQMEGSDGPNGRLYEARHAIWKAEKAVDPAEHEQLRDQAKRLINDLAAQRSDMPQVYLTLGQIDELEANRPNLSDKERKEKQYSAAVHYIRALELGQSDLPTMRRVVDLLYQMVQFLGGDRQFNRAEELIREAESVLKQASPLGLAICCESLGKAYQTVGKDPKKSQDWYGKAEDWFRIAQQAQPDDAGVNRKYVEFLIESGGLKEAATQLDAILRKPTTEGPQAAEQASWARRGLAILLIQTASDYQHVTGVLSIVEPIAKALHAQGKTASATVSAEDLRVLADVYEAQITSDYRQKAREVREQLVGMKGVTPQDRYVLANLYVRDGDWSKAQDQYRLLLAEVENSKDAASSKLLPKYVAQLILEILKHDRPGQDQQDLDRAQNLLEKLQKLSVESIVVVELQVRLYKARNQIEKARELISSEASKPSATDDSLFNLARIAGVIDQTELSEALLRKLVARSEAMGPRLSLIELLGRRGKVKEGVDLCEQLWARPGYPDKLVGSVLGLFSTPAAKREETELSRAATLFENALKTHPQSPGWAMGLGMLRESQGLWKQAEELYRRSMNLGETRFSLNNLAWLMALQKENLREALDLINRVINLRGPYSEYLDTRGGVHLSSGDYQSALKDFSEAVAQDPTGSKYFHLAQALLEAGNKDEAVKALAKAKDKGLTEDLLHPLEVPAYRQILTKMVMQ